VYHQGQSSGQYGHYEILTEAPRCGGVVYLAVSKQTVYTTLKRWVQEGVNGLDDTSHARKAPRVVTLEVTNEIRKKQENPLIGEWHMHAALLQEGIKVSPRTCGRIMAKNRALYGWDKPNGPAKPKKEMPFKATRRHEYVIGIVRKRSTLSYRG
jgi:hypothetical protein